MADNQIVLSDQESILERCIKRYLGNHSETKGPYGINADGSVKLIVSDINITLTKRTWVVTKRILDEMKQTSHDDTCAICMCTYKENRGAVFCNQCGKSYCRLCYYDIFVTNVGLIICPFCRNEHGQRQTSVIVFERMKANLMTNIMQN